MNGPEREGEAEKEKAKGVRSLESHARAHTHARARAHTRAHTFTYVHLYIYTYVHLYIYTYIHIYIYTYIHIYTVSKVSERGRERDFIMNRNQCPERGMFVHTYIHACIHTYMHAYIHTCMHACMHTYDPGRGSRALTFEHVCRRIRRVRTRRRRRERLMRTLTPRTLTQRSSLWDFFVDSCSELLFCARISVCWA